MANHLKSPSNMLMVVVVIWHKVDKLQGCEYFTRVGFIWVLSYFVKPAILDQSTHRLTVKHIEYQSALLQMPHDLLMQQASLFKKHIVQHNGSWVSPGLES